MLKLYSWGANSHGQLGLGYESEMCATPQCVPQMAPDTINLESIQKLSGGGGHLIILDKAGRLYACGWNGKGQLGLCDTVDSHVIKPLPKTQTPIADVACGWDSTAAIDDSGNLYVWGSNAFNQLGFSAELIDTMFTLPMLLNLPLREKVKKVCFGLRYMCILCENQTIYIVGRWRTAQDNCKTIWHNDTNFHQLTMPTPNLHVEDISSGSNHIVCKGTDRTTMASMLIGFGDNKFLQCNEQQLNGIGTRCLRSGWSHNGILTENGIVLLWGRNTYGQCCASTAAPNSKNVDKIDTMIQLHGIQRKIEQFHLGSEHGLVVTDKGDIFTWGWNEHGNCGDGTETNLYEPHKVQIPGNCILSTTGAGFCYALVRHDD